MHTVQYLAEAKYLVVGASLPYVIKLGVGICHGYPDRGSKQDSCNARDVDIEEARIKGTLN
jgi:hypothetical protein